MEAWHRFRALSAADRRLVAEAAALFVFIRVGLWAFSFSTLQRFLNRYARGCQLRSASVPTRETVGRVAWAVTAVARRFPGRITCLSEAIAAHTMLRRRSFRPELHFGVREHSNSLQPLDAHAWVECGGRIVVGELENLADYAVLTAPGRP